MPEGVALLRRHGGEFGAGLDRGAGSAADIVVGAGGECGGGAQRMHLGFEHGARRVARDRAAGPVGEANQLGMTEDLGFEPLTFGLDAGDVVGQGAGHRLDFFLQGALELVFGEGGTLPRHRLEHGRGVAAGDCRAQLVHVLTAHGNDAAMVTLVLLGPPGERAPAAFEVVDAAGGGIDFGSDDMDVRVILVVMRNEDRLGVGHAERGERAVRCRLHLLPGRRLPRPPGEREMHAVHAALRRAVERVEFHDAAGEIGVAPGLDVEAEAGAADPFDAGGAVFGVGLDMAGLRIATGPEDVMDGAGDAASDSDARVQKNAPAARGAAESREVGARPGARKFIAR